MTAEHSPNFLDPRALAKLKGLRLRARHIVEGFVAGLHRSPQRGFSIEFAEHRDYVPGDDLRYVDWKAYARTDKWYVKQFEDETNLICYLVLDVSQSMQYRGPNAPLSKFEYAQSLAAALAWLVLGQQDAVGLATFDHQIRAQVRPASSPTQITQILEVLEHTEPREKTTIGPIFHELAQRLSRRGVVVVLSDLFDDPAAMLAGLKHFRFRRHDVIVLQIMDPAEIDLPFEQTTLFRGLEGLPDVLADPGTIRRAYRREIDSFLDHMARGCRGHGMDYQLLRTDFPFDRALTHFLSHRMARVK